MSPKIFKRIWVAGFEPTVSCSQSKRDTKLRYAQLFLIIAEDESTRRRMLSSFVFGFYTKCSRSDLNRDGIMPRILSPLCIPFPPQEQ